MQRQSSEERPTPSSSSQGDMADTEIEADRNQETIISAPTTVTPKKKRTRTLTTPHQSAILHALLAQSRFPSTAMREEVGRSIGLSARKVQIWFQNQRQKARRPNSQNARTQQDMSVPPSPHDLAPGPSNLSPSTVDLHFAFRNPPHGSRHRFAEHPQARPGSADLSPPVQLLGPGMPGLDYRTGSSLRGHDIPARSPPPFPNRLRPNLRAHHSQSPVSMERPTTARASGSMHRPDVSRTLPPLVFDPPHQRRSCFSAPGAHTSFTRSTRSPHLESPFAHQLPEPSGHQSRPIPPPFTLQPRWNRASPSYSSRLGTPSWTETSPYLSARESSSSIRGSEHPPSDLGDHRRSRPLSPLGSHSSRGEETTLTPERPPPIRAGRYDPVRAAVIPYKGAATPTTTSPTSQSTREDPDDAQSRGRRCLSRSGSD